MSLPNKINLLVSLEETPLCLFSSHTCAGQVSYEFENVQEFKLLVLSLVELYGGVAFFREKFIEGVEFNPKKPIEKADDWIFINRSFYKAFCAKLESIDHLSFDKLLKYL